MSHRCSRHFWDRREFLFTSGGGISGLALAYLLDRDGLLAAAAGAQSDACAAAGHWRQSLRAEAAAFQAARHGRHLALHGRRLEPGGHVRSQAGADQIRGQPIDGKVKGDVIVRQGSPGPLMPSPFTFKKYGQSGIEVSEIFPLLSQHVDEIAFLRSVYGRSNDHVQGTYEMQTGRSTWVSRASARGSPTVWARCVQSAGVRRDDRRPRRTAGRTE